MKDDINDYISLKDAAKICAYSQEYLSLRARQGKIKAMKFGRNWVTKKEWLNEYLKAVGEYNEKLEQKKGIFNKVLKASQPPNNLPAGNFQFDPKNIKIQKPVVEFAFSLALVSLLLVMSGLFFFYQVNEITEGIGVLSSDIFLSIEGVYQEIDPILTDLKWGFSYLGASIVIAGNNLSNEAVVVFNQVANNFNQQVASVGSLAGTQIMGFLYLQIVIAGFGGGLVRGLIGFIKYQFSYKNMKFELPYFLVMMFLSGIIGTLIAVAVSQAGFTFIGYFTPAIAFIVGYAGGDFLENIYKIIIKKSSLYGN